MASKSTIPSVDLNEDNVASHKAALDQVRPGLTEDVPDPNVAKDPVNDDSWAKAEPYTNKYF
jgi:hypothetical protein